MEIPTAKSPSHQGRRYVAPQVEMHGSAAEMTSAFVVGISIDGTYPANTSIISHTSV